MAKVSDLPNELLRYLFQMLTPEDRKLAVLVDRKWRKVGEDPVLWKWCIARINNGADINKLSVGRFKYVQQINVDPMFNWQPQQLDELFQATLELPKLKEIDGLAPLARPLDLSFVNSDLLGRALGKLEKLIFTIGHGNTTNDQNMAIFNEMAEKCCMKILRLEVIGLVELDVEILSRVMSGLQELLLSYVSLTSDQVSAVFKSMSENNQLSKVRLYSLNVSSVEPDLFGIGVTNIEDVYLGDMEISPYQARALFTEMGQNKRIKKFWVMYSNLSTVDPKLIARGLSKLEEVTLHENNLTHGQVQAIFIELNQNCKLKVLGLCSNNLSSAHPDDLSMVVNNIEVVRMRYTQLSTEQITAVLTRTQQNTKLKRLDILGNDISEVDPVILATAGEILEELDIDSDSEDEESGDSDSEDEESGDSDSEDEESDDSDSEDEESDEDENLEFSASENDIVGESDT